MHHAAIILSLETIGQIKEDQSDRRLLEMRQEDRERLLITIKKVSSITADRLRNAETNVKSHVFLHMAIAQIEAMEQGIDTTAHVLESATSAARQAFRILRDRSTQEDMDRHRFELPEFESASLSANRDFPFPLPENGDTGLELGDVANWLFSDWVDQYPL
jgi:hypothetical protein